MAALAPALASTLYGLDIIEENVEDTDSNVTRFVVLTRNKQWAERPSSDAKMMTTFIFRVRNVPAALYKAMGGFPPTASHDRWRATSLCVHGDCFMPTSRPSRRSTALD